MSIPYQFTLAWLVTQRRKRLSSKHVGQVLWIDVASRDIWWRKPGAYGEDAATVGTLVATGWLARSGSFEGELVRPIDGASWADVVEVWRAKNVACKLLSAAHVHVDYQEQLTAVASGGPRRKR